MSFKVGDKVTFKTDSFWEFKSCFPWSMYNWKLNTVGVIVRELNGGGYDWIIKAKNCPRVHVGEAAIQHLRGQLELPLKFRRKK